MCSIIDLLPSLEPISDTTPAAVVTKEDLMTNYPALSQIQASNAGLLFFWAESAFFQFDAQKYDGGPCVILSSDTNGRPVATTRRQWKTEDETAAFCTKSKKLEFIAVANPKSFGMRSGLANKIVMLVKRRHGVAYRVDLGEIDMEAWAAATPQMGLVTLG
jgi:hypothetical protein